MPRERFDKIRMYLNYVDKRIEYLKILGGGIISNEIRYWVGLKSSIKTWGKSHVIYYECLHRNLSLRQASNLFGASERTTARMFKKQRKELVAFIGMKEIELKALYPFIPMTDVFEMEGGIKNES